MSLSCMYLQTQNIKVFVKFKYFEKATKFCEISTLLLSYVVPVKRKTKLKQPAGQTFFPTFPKELSHFLQTLGSHSKVHLENAKKSLVHIMKSGLDGMPLFLLDDLLNKFCS